MFNVDPHQDNLADSLDAALSATEKENQRRTGKSPHIYALIDGVFDQKWGAALLWQQSQAVNVRCVRSLYTGSRLEALEECAPFLVIIEPEERWSALQGLLARTDHKPMLTFVQSPLDLFALQRHLVRFSQIETPDTLVFPLRFADGICLPEIIDVFTVEQRAAILSGVTGWHYVDRRGGVVTIAGTCNDADLYMTPAYGEIDRIPFSDSQYVQLFDSSEADGILNALSAKHMPIFKQVKVSILFQRVQTALQEMDRRNIKEEKSRKELAYVCLHLPDSHAVNILLDIAQNQGLEAALESW